MRYDIVVIGGGLFGVGVARDAALRGLSVCLFEREDFGAGASGRSPQLVAGGLPALESLDFARVRADVHERETLLQTAPDLIVAQPCLLPFYGSGLRQQARLRAGLALGDALALDQSLRIHHLLSPAETLARAPALSPDGLTGAALGWEASAPDPARRALAVALDARRHGARLRPHTPVESINWEPAGRGRERAAGVVWRDALTGERGQTEASLVIAATGARLSGLDPRLEGSTSGGLRKDVSVLLPLSAGLGDALVLPLGDGQMLSAVAAPEGLWVGGLEIDFDGDVGTAYATRDEVAALTGQARAFLPGGDWDGPLLAQAAVRPAAPAFRPFGIPAPEVRDWGADGGKLDGLLTVAGGPAVRARVAAEEATDWAVRKLGRALSAPACRTASAPLPASGAPNLSADAPALRAAVEWAVAEEECRTLRDFLGRRQVPASASDGTPAAWPAALAAMADLLGWDADRRAREVKAREAAAALTQAFRVL